MTLKASHGLNLFLEPIIPKQTGLIFFYPWKDFNKKNINLCRGEAVCLFERLVVSTPRLLRGQKLSLKLEHVGMVG